MAKPILTNDGRGYIASAKGRGRPQPEPLVAILLTLLIVAVNHQQNLYRRRIDCHPEAAIKLAYWSLTGSWS